MKKMLCVAALAVCTMGLQGFALAADVKAEEAGSCEAKAIDKNGKALAGAAKTSFIKKCEAEAKPACEAKAIDKNGKALAGAAKASFIKKCEADAHTMH
jgi:opacity protein-like surface antigen